jgi:hypothetical protein
MVMIDSEKDFNEYNEKLKIGSHMLILTPKYDANLNFVLLHMFMLSS